MREHHTRLTELSERQELLMRPWEGEFVHWSYRNETWELHGHRPPPADGRRRGATQDGWCTCPGSTSVADDTPTTPDGLAMTLDVGQCAQD